MPKHTDKKTFLIAQSLALHITHYYEIEARTMGEAIAMIEIDPRVIPFDSEMEDATVLGYEEAEKNYDS